MSFLTIDYLLSIFLGVSSIVINSYNDNSKKINQKYENLFFFK
jgi:hypothetical protein